MSKQQDLKEASDGLSKVWKVQDSHEPFYSGGHCEVVLAPSSSSNSSSTHTDHDLLACMYEDNIKLMNWATGQHELTLLPEGAADEDTDNAEKVSTFCMHPSGQELVLATPQGLLRHFSCRVKESVTDAEKREAQALVAAAPTGASVNSSSSNNSKAPAWEFVRAIKAHTMPVLTMAYDSTGTLVATGSADRSVKVWDISRGYCTHSFKGHTDVVQLVQFHIPASFYSGGGSGGGGGGGGGNLQLYSTSHDYTLKIYDLNDSTCVSTFKEHLSVATALATASASGDEYLLASVGRDKVINFYETRKHTHIATAACMDELEGCFFLTAPHAQQVLGAGAGTGTGTGQHVFVTGGSRGALRLFAVSHTFHAGKKSVFSCLPLVVIPVSGTGGTLRTSIPRHGMDSLPPKVDETKEIQPISGLLYLPERPHSQIVAITADQTLCCYELSTSQPAAAEVAVLSKRAAAASTATSEAELVLTRQLVGTHDDILDLCCLPTHDYATHGKRAGKSYQLAIASNSPHIRLTDMLTKTRASGEKGAEETASRSVLLYGHADVVLALDGSPNGRWLISSSKDRTVRLWDLAAGGLGSPQCVAIGVGHTEGVGCVCLSSRASAYAEKRVFAFSASGDKIIKRWSLRAVMDVADSGMGTAASHQQLQATHSVRGHDKDINTVAMSPNDSLLASGSQDKTIKIWTAADLSSVATLRGHKRGVWKLAFSSIDRILCSGSGDRTVRLWSMADYTCLKTLEGHSASVLTVRFVSFRMPPVAGELGGDMDIAGADDEEEKDEEESSSHHHKSHNRRQPTYNSMQILSGSADGLLRLWDVRSGECVKTFDEHQDKLWTLAFPRDGGFTEESRTDKEEEEEEEEDTPGSWSSSAVTNSLGAFFVSGSSDSRVLVWTDATQAEERDRLQLAESRTLVEQAMDNDVRAGRYDKALKAALELGHSHRVLKILTAILEQDTNNSRISRVPIAPRHGQLLAPYVKEWGPEQLEAVTSYLLEWNTNAKYCFVSQCTLQAMLEVHGVTTLMQVRCLRSQLPALIAYGERHFLRVDRLHQAAYVLEYMGSLMSLLPQEEEEEEEKEAPGKGNRLLLRMGDKGRAGGDGDVLDIFGTASSLRKVSSESNSDSDSDSGVSVDSALALRQAAQTSFSGLVAGSSEEDSEAEEEEEEEEEVEKSTGKDKKGKKGSSTSASAGKGTTPVGKGKGKGRKPDNPSSAIKAGKGKGGASPSSSGPGSKRKSGGSGSGSKTPQEDLRGKGSSKKRRRGGELKL